MKKEKKLHLLIKERIYLDLKGITKFLKFLKKQVSLLCVQDGKNHLAELVYKLTLTGVLL